MLQIISISGVLLAMMVLVDAAEKKCEKKHFALLVRLVFVCYLCGNLYFTVLSRNPGTCTQIHLVPFSSYKRLMELSTEGISTISGFAAKFLKDSSTLTGIILNVFLFYPLGYLLPMLFPRMKPRHVILLGCLCSAAIEAAQYLFKMGWCETDDTLHNTLGTAIGVWVWSLRMKRAKHDG